MKRKNFLSVICVAVVIIILVFHFSPSPIDKLDFEYTYSVELYDYSGEKILQTLSEEDAYSLIAALQSAEISKIGSEDYKNRNGFRSCMFKIVSDNDTFNISSVSPYLVINGKGYKCDSETLAVINSIWENNISQHYPV